MSTFNVHEWNRKRRLSEMEDNTEDMRSEAVTQLIDAIEIAKNYNLFNAPQELVLDQIVTSLIKKMARERGDLGESVLGFNSEEEFMQMLLDYVREKGKTDELLQMLKAQGMSEEEVKYILDYIGLTLEIKFNRA